MPAHPNKILTLFRFLSLFLFSLITLILSDSKTLANNLQREGFSLCSLPRSFIYQHLKKQTLLQFSLTQSSAKTQITGERKTSTDPKMNDTDVQKQIQQMVRFIRQEAEEKANEISVAAEEEFNIEKLQLVEAEKKKIKQEYERKAKQVEVRRKIEYSMQLNASRIKVLQAQDDLVNSMREEASKELVRVCGDHHQYRKLLKELVVQSLLRLKEPGVLLRCRKDDLHLVEHILDSAKEEYAEKASVHSPEIVVDDIYLPSGPGQDNDVHALSCSGGVVVASRDGKIVCENTLDARLEVAFRKKLPQIRKQLFGIAAA